MGKEQYAKCRECENGKIKIIITHPINGDIVITTKKCDNCNYDLNENDFVDLLAGNFLNGDIGSEDEKCAFKMCKNNNKGQKTYGCRKCKGYFDPADF